MAKIRTDFVTNSSSSSFIIACKKLPETVEEAADVWFGEFKEYVAPIILKHLFSDLKEFVIDFDKLLDKAKNDDLRRYHFDESTPEDTVISELFSDFSFAEEYGSGSYWSSMTVTPFKQYEEEEIEKLLEKYPDAEKEYDIPYLERMAVQEAWYKKPEVRERFVVKVQNFIDTFKGFDCLMSGTFADEDGALGSELEHGDHWDRFPKMIRFSHH